MKYATLLSAIGGIGLAAFTTGCGYELFPGQGVTNDYRDFIPASAYSVGTGEGSVSYVATEPGTVYLIDHNRYDKVKRNDPDDKRYAPHVIGSYRLMKAQGVSVDGASQTVTVGSAGNTTPTVFKLPGLSADNSYELRLDPVKRD